HAENFPKKGTTSTRSCLFNQPLKEKPSPLRAIIRLTKVRVSKPKVEGEAKLKIDPLEGGIAWTVKGQVGDRWGKFLLDTGASISMLTPEFVNGLGLKGKALPKEATRYALAGNDCQNIEATLHNIPLLQLGNAKIKNLQALELSQTVIPAALDGVLGMDVLTHFQIEVDPRQRELKLLSRDRPINPKNAPIPLVMREGVALVKVKLNQQQETFLFMIDTGAESTFISPQIAKSLQLDPKKLNPIQVQGFCGLESARSTNLERLQVGNQTIKQLETVILSNTAVLDSLQVDGILGQNFLNQFQQIWHFDLSPNPSPGKLYLTPISDL
ncbi:MAG: aspartyl protease family protein, partial [Microcystaceae cyanobacterium]